MSTVVAETYRRSKIHPKKFALWAACASMLMLFSGLTSAYIVRQAAGNWLEFRLPAMFFANTVVILLSSIALHTSYSGFKNGQETKYKVYMVIAFFLGLAFVIMQYLAWQQMVEIGVPLKANPSGDFVYVITGIHAAHVIGGIGTLMVAMIHAFSLKYECTAGRKLRFELTLTYWHFVDFLWVYLLLFLVLSS